MKEATGELNMTVIVVLIVAVLSFFFFSILWPNIKAGLKHSTNCDSAICACPGGYRNANGKCTYSGTTVECQIKGTSQTITCPWKG